MSEGTRFQIFLALVNKHNPSEEETKEMLEVAARLEKAWESDAAERRPKPAPPPPAPQQLAAVPQAPQAPRAFMPPQGTTFGARVSAAPVAPAPGTVFGSRVTGALPQVGTGPIPPPGAQPAPGVAFSAPSMVVHAGQPQGQQAPARSIVFENRAGAQRIDPATGAPLQEDPPAAQYDPRLAAYAATQAAAVPLAAPPVGMAGASVPQPPPSAAQQWAQIRDACHAAGLGPILVQLRQAFDQSGADGVTDLANKLQEETALWLLEVGVLYEHNNQLGLSLLGIELGGFFAAQRAN